MLRCREKHDSDEINRYNGHGSAIVKSVNSGCRRVRARGSEGENWNTGKLETIDVNVRSGIKSR